MQIWDIWYPNAAAQGLSFCRARIDPADTLMLHAAPNVIRVDVRDDDGALVASGEDLRREGRYFPMTRLRIEGASIVREDGWPAADDIGRVVLLAGGEAGIITSWWNADDGREWRWSVEFYNRLAG